ncbi:monovalent cation/H+ antiporter subunit E [Haloferacaceae archaeon DSL9]
MGAEEHPRLLVPIKQSVTLRNSVAYAVQAAAEAGASGNSATIHFVGLATWRADDPGTDADRRRIERLLERAVTWADQDLEEVAAARSAVAVETAVVGDESYLFSPDDYAEALCSYADEHELTHVILDPEYTLIGHTTLLQPLEAALSAAGLTVEEAPVERPTRRERLVGNTTPMRFGAIFVTSYFFYLVLGGFSGLFDVVTGAASALVVAISLSGISFFREPSLSASPKRLLRGLVYVPYLLFEIIKSNIAVSRVILDPRLPIDPRLTRVHVLVGSGLPLMTLANSITLTPGTLTVRATNQELYIHSLIPEARDGLFDGGLEKWVRFVFYGRGAARFPSPRERGDVEILQGEEAPYVVSDGGSIDGAPVDGCAVDGEPDRTGGGSATSNDAEPERGERE